MYKCMYVHVYMFFSQGTIRQTFMNHTIGYITCYNKHAHFEKT